MPLTPETVVQHELNGLRVRVVEADSPAFVGIEGRVVRETTNTLVIESDGDDARARTVPKASATFEFALPDGEYATVAGERLVARPARRTQTAGGSIWHSD